MTDPKPFRHRFPLTLIQHAVGLSHRVPLRDRDVQERLHQRGTLVSLETLRECCLQFGSLFADALRQREPRWGSRWHLIEVCTTVDGVRDWLWRAVEETGCVLDLFLQRQRDTEAAKPFLTRLLGEADVPEAIHTDQLRNYGAVIRELLSLVHVDPQQGVSTARCNNLALQSHRPTRRQERSQQGFRRRKRAREGLCLHASMGNLHHHTRTSVPTETRRLNQKKAFQTWSSVAAGMA